MIRKCIFNLGQWSVWLNVTYQDDATNPWSRLAYLRSKGGEPVYTVLGVQFFGSDLPDATASVVMLTVWRLQVYIARWREKDKPC